MSEKCMAVSLIVLEIQRKKWIGGILPPAAGIRDETNRNRGQHSLGTYAHNGSIRMSVTTH